MTFTAGQIKQLLRPIHPSRVLKDGKSKSHVSQQDVRAHLIRVFGYGAWDLVIDGPELVFEQPSLDADGKAKPGRFDVCYRAKAHLTIRDPKGSEVCHYEGSATATAQNQSRGDAHGLALRSAESLALKRAAINLGDQFGLSLYNKGQLKAMVMGLIVRAVGRPGPETPDVQDDLPKQESLGHDEDIEDVLPRNKDGKISRSRATDEQLAAAGAMTRDQLKEHNALRRSGQPKPDEIEHLTAIDEDDPWATGGATDE